MDPGANSGEAPTAAVGSQPGDPGPPRQLEPTFTMEQVMSLVNSITKQSAASAVTAALSSGSLPSRHHHDFYLPPFDPDERSHDIRDWCAHVDETISKFNIPSYEARMKAILQLRGRAKTWADTWSLSSTTWDQVKCELIQTFGREFRYADDVQKWRAFTSDHASSYAEYATKAWTLFKRVRPEASDAEVVDAVVTVNFVDRWPLMEPNDVAFILISYLLFVMKIGPVLMKNRNPVQMKKFLIFFNIVKVVNSGVLAYKFLRYTVDKGLFPRRCEHDETTLYTIAALYWKYTATKIFDLFDTIFFVIRKKPNQVTFLHVYHHTFMVMIAWSFLKYDPSDHWSFMAIMNCSIHCIMYTYYGIAALGPSYSRFLWWKKYLTLMQLSQFILVIAHMVIQTSTSSCPIHPISYWVGLSNLTLFVFLFADFYKKSYQTGTVAEKDLGGFCTNPHIN